MEEPMLRCDRCSRDCFDFTRAVEGWICLMCVKSELSDLRAENARLRRELDNARSDMGDLMSTHSLGVEVLRRELEEAKAEIARREAPVRNVQRDPGPTWKERVFNLADERDDWVTEATELRHQLDQIRTLAAGAIAAVGEMFDGWDAEAWDITQTDGSNEDAKAIAECVNFVRALAEHFTKEKQ